jgi:CheY-like chemotaxis protein
MNLVINGAEAVGSHPGIITLTTGVIHPNAETFSGCPYAPAKIAETCVFLEVRDNGHGMPPEVLSRIFEPFFTTKFSGRGLGLAAALGIVRSHEGALRVESTPGQGSTFTLYLPAIAATDVEEPPTVSTSTPWSSDGTVLIVDDEAPVREVARRMAQTLGYKTLIAEDGQRGLEVFRQSNSHIGVVLLDVTMPGITGEETLSKLREISPGVHVVMMSGYNRPENIPPAPSGAAPVFLSKPFTMAQFQSALRRATKQS